MNPSETSPEAVAIYARVSTQDQDPDNQVQALQEWAARRGWGVAQVFTDRGVSGTVPFTRRPAAEALLMEAHRGGFSRVLIFALDRLDRGGVRVLDNTWRTLQDRGLKVESLREPWASTPGAGELLRHVYAWLAADEVARLSARIRAGMARSRAQGVVPGRPRALGVDEGAIVDAWVQGTPVARIARGLNLSRSMVNRRLADLDQRGQIGTLDDGARWRA